jgi:hypothetical protein
MAVFATAVVTQVSVSGIWFRLTDNPEISDYGAE